MSQLGIGATLAMLGGNQESAETFSAAIGKEIAALELKDDQLYFTMGDGSRFCLFDDGQSCCESRYMTTDADLPYFVGATLSGAEMRSAPSVETEYDAHDCEFLDVLTSKGTFQMVSHNEHNGYYGGFVIRAKAVKD